MPEHNWQRFRAGRIPAVAGRGSVAQGLQRGQRLRQPSGIGVLSQQGRQQQWEDKMRPHCFGVKVMQVVNANAGDVRSPEVQECAVRWYGVSFGGRGIGQVRAALVPAWHHAVHRWRAVTAAGT